jgi:WD40 repeat protein
MSAAPDWTAALGDHVGVLAWAPTGDRLLAGSLAGDAAIFDAHGHVERKLDTHAMGVLTGAWYPTGRSVAVGGQDGVVRTTELDGTATTFDLGGWVTALAWAPDGSALAAGAGRHLHLVDTATDTVRRYDPAPSTVTAVTWSPDGSRVGAAAYGGIRWHEPGRDTDAPVRVFDWKGSLLSLAVSPTGRWVCAGSQDATVHLWRLWSAKDLSMSGYPAKIEHLAFRDDGRWMANACLGEITVWDFAGKGPAGTAPAQADAHDRHVTALAWQPGGELLATAGADGSVALWPSPRRAGQAIAPLCRFEHRVAVASLAWAPDGSRLAVGRDDGTIETHPVEP